MTYLVYDKEGELEDIVNFDSLEELGVYEKSHLDAKLEFAEEEDFSEDEDYEPEGSDNSHLEW